MAVAAAAEVRAEAAAVGDPLRIYLCNSGGLSILAHQSGSRHLRHQSLLCSRRQWCRMMSSGLRLSRCSNSRHSSLHLELRCTRSGAGSPPHLGRCAWDAKRPVGGDTPVEACTVRIDHLLFAFTRSMHTRKAPKKAIPRIPSCQCRDHSVCLICMLPWLRRVVTRAMAARASAPCRRRPSRNPKPRPQREWASGLGMGGATRRGTSRSNPKGPRRVADGDALARAIETQERCSHRGKSE